MLNGVTDEDGRTEDKERRRTTYMYVFCVMLCNSQLESLFCYCVVWIMWKDLIAIVGDVIALAAAATRPVTDWEVPAASPTNKKQNDSFHGRRNSSALVTASNGGCCARNDDAAAADYAGAMPRISGATAHYDRRAHQDLSVHLWPHCCCWRYCRYGIIVSLHLFCTYSMYIDIDIWKAKI